MEDILELYQTPHNSRRPLVCMDEQPIQLIRETRTPIPPDRGQPARYDYEYERNGTAANFLFTEPLAGWRKVSIREHRTRLDWAYEMKDLLDRDYADAEKVLLVCDNLNTHTMGSLYEAFDPVEARRLACRIEIHYTPKHGSWLNIAEIELSAMTKQCLDRRIPDIETLRSQTRTWAHERNTRQKGVDWQFTTGDARTKLKHLYPHIKMS